MTAYIKSLDDELDWNLVNQLHNVVLQISSFCFRTKQVCLTVDIAVLGLIAKFTNDQLDVSIFVVGLIIPAAFWILDSIAFVYQVKLRGMMENIRDGIRERNKAPVITGVVVSEVIDDSRVNRSQLSILQNSFFNHSMWIYLLLVLANVVGYVLFVLGVIQ